MTAQQYPKMIHFKGGLKRTWGSRRRARSYTSKSYRRNWLEEPTSSRRITLEVHTEERELKEKIDGLHVYLQRVTDIE